MSRKLILLMSVLTVLLGVGVLSAKANQLTNGNFNSGTTTGWWTWVPDANTGLSVQSAYNYDGTPNVELSSWNTAWPDAGPVAIGQTFDLTENTDWSLSFVYSSQWTDWGTADYLVKYYNVAWAEIGYEWATLFEQEPGPTDWVPVNLNFTSPAGTMYADVQFRTYEWTNAFYVDNVVVTPEPATLLMLCAGGLSLLRNRRG